MRASFVLSFAALALGACAGTPRAQPEMPAGVTTTTGAAAPAAPIEPTAPIEPAAAPLVVGGNANAPPPAAAGAPTLTDAEIAGIVNAACEAEGQQAREAAKRSTGDRVQELARVVAKAPDLGKLERVEQLDSITERESPTSAHLKDDGTKVSASLRAASSGTFDELYLDSQISQDKRLISLLDDQLIPQVKSMELRRVLEDLRTSTSSHLGMAEDIRSPARR